MPNALLYGVPYETFWHLNPKKLEPFRTAYNKKMEMYNYNAWLNGLYVQKAIGSCFSKSSQYPKEPIGKEIKSDAKPLTDAEKFAMYATQYNKQHKFEE